MELENSILRTGKVGFFPRGSSRTVLGRRLGTRRTTVCTVDDLQCAVSRGAVSRISSVQFPEVQCRGSAVRSVAPQSNTHNNHENFFPAHAGAGGCVGGVCSALHGR